jgi:pimeloyl-ACP methyl ester carboxylesterase
MWPHVDDLAAFLRAIDAVPAHLVGNSWGAFIALLTAIRHPDLVRTLVLEEAPVMPLFVSAPPRPPERVRC